MKWHDKHDVPSRRGDEEVMSPLYSRPHYSSAHCYSIGTHGHSDEFGSSAYAGFDGEGSPQQVASRHREEAENYDDLIHSGIRDQRRRRRRRPRTLEEQERSNTATGLHLLEDALSRPHNPRPSRSRHHVDLLERNAALKVRMFEPQSSATTKALTDTIIACNSLAMSALGRGDTLRCKELLARAFKIACYKRSHNGDDYDGDDYDGDDFSEPGAGGDRSGAVAALQVLTLNNTACLHRRLGEPKRALRYLRKAAELGRKSGGSEHLEVTHLNACAVLSELGRHEEALEHARYAVFYGQEHEEAAGGRSIVDSRGPEEMAGMMGSGSRDSDGSRRTRLATLAVSYYNLAVEFEYTRRYDACLRWYSEAVELARDPDVRNEDLVKTFERSFAAARKKYARFDRVPVTRKFTPSRDDLLTRKEGRSPRTAVSGFDKPVRNSSRWSPTLHDDDVRRASFDGHSGHDSRLSYEGTREKLDSGPQWPHLGRMERQRAGDQRRSTSSGGNNGRQKASPVAMAASTMGYSWGNERQLSRPRSADTQGLENTLPHNSSTEAVFGVGGVRIGGIGGGGGDRGGGDGGDDVIDSDPWYQGREGFHRRGSRERPASADVPRERHRERRQNLRTVSRSIIQRGSHAASEDPIPWRRQRSRDDVRENALYKSKYDPGWRLGGGRRVGAPRYRRPKSAYPRLEDQIRPGGSGREIGDVRCTDNGRSDEGARAERTRSSSAHSFRNKLVATMPVSDSDGVGSRRNSRSRPEGEHAGRKRVKSAQHASQVHKNIGRNDRLKRAKVVGVEEGNEEGTERGRQWSGAGDQKSTQTSAVSSHRGVDRKKDVLADQAYVTDLAIRTRQMDWSEHIEQGGDRDADPTASTRHTKSVTDSPTREREKSATRDTFGGICHGRDGKIYVYLEDDEDTAALMSTGRNAAFCLEDNIIPEARVEVEAEDAMATTMTQAPAEETFEVVPVIHVDADPFSFDEKQRLDAVTPADGSRIDSIPRNKINVHDIAPDLLEVSHTRVPMIEKEGIEERCQEDTFNEAKEMEAPVVGVIGKESVQEWSLSQLNVDGVSSGLSMNKSAVIIQREIRCLLARRAVDRRRTLAAAVIQMWVFPIVLRRRQLRKRARDIRRRWEREIRRIAATHIQALARGWVARRECWRRMRAMRELQRFFRGWKGKREAVELAHQRYQDRYAACESIQRFFRGHQRRRRAVRRWNIHREETIARNGAATLIQHAWQSRREMACAQVAVKSAAVSQTTKRKQESMPGAVDVATGSPQRPSSPDANEHSLQELVRQSKELQWRQEADASMYTLWGAFTSLLISMATRCCVTRDVAAALLSPAAETLAAFGRERHSHHPSSSPPFGTVGLQKIVPALVDRVIARDLERNIHAARRRLSMGARTWSASLSDIRAAAVTLVGAPNKAVTADSATEAAREEVGAIILEAVQESWTLLSSSGMGSLAGVEDGLIHEKLTAMLATTLQDIVTDLGRIESLLGSPPARAFWITCENCSALVRLSHVAQTSATLVGALASSAAASLICHSAFEEEILRYCDNRSLPAWEDGFNEGYGRLEAEVYGLVLTTPFSTGMLGSDSFEENHRAQQRIFPNNNASNSTSTEGGSIRRPTSCLRAREWSELLLSVLIRIEETAEEIVRILNASCSSSDSRYSKRQENIDGFAKEIDFAALYNGAIQLLAENIWELATSLSPPVDEEQEDGALRLDYAASSVQNRARRKLAQRRWPRIRQQKESAIIAIQRFTRRRAQRVQSKRHGERVRRIRQSLATTVSIRAIEETIEVIIARQSLIATPLRDADTISDAHPCGSETGWYAPRGEGRKRSVLRTGKTRTGKRLSKAEIDRKKSVSFRHKPNDGGVWNSPTQSSRSSLPLLEFDCYPREHEQRLLSETTEKDEEETFGRDINADDTSVENDSVGATLRSTHGLGARTAVDIGHNEATSSGPLDVQPGALMIPGHGQQQQQQAEEFAGGHASRGFYLSPDTSSAADTRASFPCCLSSVQTRPETTDEGPEGEGDILDHTSVVNPNETDDEV